ncbi:MAG: N-acetyl-gamma-glutamyl-phosphate reductase [Planctomycetes bacterium]|nr:N-acetyl-gamma-glutamyl-phosphate reductase [Planctomycetota bacterium]
MVRIAILGATGYAALELIKILLSHPEAEIVAVTARQDGSPHIESVHPSLAGCLDLVCEDLESAQVAERADFAFCTLPHGLSSAVIPELLAAGCRVVDLSPDYRLNDASVYEQWYGVVHTDPTRLGSTVYGLPEVWAERLREAELVANPGSFTNAVVLGLGPLLAGQDVEPTGIVIDAKCGVSGAGRSPKMMTLFPECNESVSPFSVARHRQTPEIEQVLTQIAGQPVETVFIPHLVPMDRGILCTIYAPLTRSVDENQLLDRLREFYAEKPFVRVVDHLPSTKDTLGTNFCDITVRCYRGRAIVIACLDNLVKGAAGVAVQNFNLMCGFAETTALLPGAHRRRRSERSGEAE